MSHAGRLEALERGFRRDRTIAAVVAAVLLAAAMFVIIRGPRTVRHVDTYAVTSLLRAIYVTRNPAPPKPPGDYETTPYDRAYETWFNAVYYDQHVDIPAGDR